jgi:hypothetical protein
MWDRVRPFVVSYLEVEVARQTRKEVNYVIERKGL